MSLQKYSHYKACDLPSLREIPEHWELRSNRSVLTLIKSTVGEDWSQTQLLSLTLRGVVTRDIDSGEGKYPADFGTYQRVYPEDLVFCLFDLDETPRTVGLSVQQGMITGAYDVFRCNDHVLPAFVHYYYLYLDSFKGLRPYYTGLRKVVRPSTFLSVKLPLPPLLEQAMIVRFLDRETSKIDSLVAEQRRLIELLKEKRQAVISHAVTKGLNPHAPMKPSGIPWLGDVPGHWEITPVKYLANVGNGSTPSREVPEYWTENGFPWLNSSVVNQTVVTEAEGFVSDVALRECHLPIIEPPAVLVGITGQGRTRGMAAMLGIVATINQHVAYVKPNDAILDVNFLLRAFESAYEKLRRDSEEAGATKGAITCEQIRNLRIPVPPILEQGAIVNFLDAETAKLNSLTAEAERAIELLQERRTALISATVTGRIDVRGLA